MKLVGFIGAVLMASPAGVFGEGVKMSAGTVPPPLIRRMHRQPVESGAITLIGYHRKTSALEIRFHTGGIYRYTDVPSAVFEEFISAKSKGRYFRDNVRGRYRYWRVERQA